jgi:hypothetical protein
MKQLCCYHDDDDTCHLYSLSTYLFSLYLEVISLSLSMSAVDGEKVLGGFLLYISAKRNLADLPCRSVTEIKPRIKFLPGHRQYKYILAVVYSSPYVLVLVPVRMAPYGVVPST